MTDQEKSVLLAKAMGLDVDAFPPTDSIWQRIWLLDEWHWNSEWITDFYARYNFELVWRVLNWGYTQHDRMIVVIDGPDVPLAYWGWRINNLLWSAARMEADKAVRHILDGIFDLAVNAGIIEEKE